MAPGPAQAAADIGLHWSTSQEVPNKHPVTGFRWYQSITQLYPQMTQPKGALGRHQSSTKVNPALWGQPLHNSLCTVINASPHSQSL